MQDEVRQVQPLSDDIDEEWVRDTGDQLRGVGAHHSKGSFDPPVWCVTVSAMEFIREYPYEDVYIEQVTDALRKVPGVTRAAEQGSRGQWIVDGQPSGKALVEAVARLVDALDTMTRKEIGWPYPPH